MAKFKVLFSNFKVSTMVEHGTLAFFLNGVQIIAARDSIDSKDMVLTIGEHEYQWQVNGNQDVTRYSIRLLSNGVSIPQTGVGPRVLKGGNIDFSGGTFTIN